jgi:hypothetical protein
MKSHIRNIFENKILENGTWPWLKKNSKMKISPPLNAIYIMQKKPLFWSHKDSQP